MNEEEINEISTELDNNSLSDDFNSKKQECINKSEILNSSKSSQISLLKIKKVQNPVNNQEIVLKKRGRPRKSDKIIQDYSLEVTSSTSSYRSDSIIGKELKSNDNEVQMNINKKHFTTRRRLIKPPLRYQGAVHGKEYEKIYQELEIKEKSSVNDENDDDINANNGDVNDDDDNDDNVIGFVQTVNGESLGDLIMILNDKNSSLGNNLEKNRKINATNNIKQKTLLKCDVCKISFSQEHKFLDHRFSHKNVRFECKECLKTFINKNLLIEHQTKENHYGAGIIEDFNELQKRCN